MADTPVADPRYWLASAIEPMIALFSRRNRFNSAESSEVIPGPRSRIDLGARPNRTRCGASTLAAPSMSHQRCMHEFSKSAPLATAAGSAAMVVFASDIKCHFRFEAAGAR